jgi:putative transposase
VLRDYRAAGKFRLHAFVVMPDHFHLLITVGSDMIIERAIQLAKGGFAFRAGKELGVKAPIWQKVFPKSGFSIRRRLRTNESTSTTI